VSLMTYSLAPGRRTVQIGRLCRSLAWSVRGGGPESAGGSGDDKDIPELYVVLALLLRQPDHGTDKGNQGRHSRGLFGILRGIEKHVESAICRGDNGAGRCEDGRSWISHDTEREWRQAWKEASLEGDRLGGRQAWRG
jgi:hypothetical protein